MAGYPSRYVFFDTETNVPDDDAEWKEAELRLRLGVMKITDPLLYGDDRGRYTDFDSIERFHATLACLPLSKTPVWVFAHNAGFDLRIVDFFGYLADGWYVLIKPGSPHVDGKFRMPLVVLENPPLIVKCWRPDGQEFVFCDTFQWINMSLASVGKNMGKEKGVMPKPDAPLQDWYDYCRLDVDVLELAYKNIWAWLQDNGIRAFHATRAGQSRLIYRERYERNRIRYPESDSDVKLDRLGYYGGRTDLWHVGRKQGPIYQLDINSLYPYVMSRNFYPTGVKGRIEAIDDGMSVSPELAGSMTAEVYLDSPDIGYPVRCRDGTWFCRGMVRTVLPGPEFRAAVRRGHVRRIGRATRHDMGMLFDGFIGDYWRMRCEAKVRGDKVSDLIIKLLMNSLYGKFGQQTGEWVYHDHSDGDYAFGEAFEAGGPGLPDVEYRKIGGYVFRKEEQAEAKGSFIPIAAYVTSYARVLMDKMRVIAGHGHYFYQATDSLYVDDEGYRNLGGPDRFRETDLGRFKHESTYQEVTFRNIHNLDKDGTRVRGSVKPKAKEINPDEYVVVNWESLSTALIRSHVSHVKLTKITKNLNPRYLRQEVLPGGACRPWMIDNWHLSPEEQAKKPVPKVSPDREE